jgi:hypothetical protein
MSLILTFLQAFCFALGVILFTLITVHAAEDHRLWARQGPCTSLCANIRSAGASCTNYDCLCPTVLISGAACSSCLVTVAMNTTQAAQIAAILSTCEHPDACVSECSNIAMAAGMCGSNLGCLCPTVLASGSGCLSCLQASHTNPTDACVYCFVSVDRMSGNHVGGQYVGHDLNSGSDYVPEFHSNHYRQYYCGSN